MILKVSTMLMVIILLLSAKANAQDTLWVKKVDGKPYVIHQVHSGEDIFMLSKRYSVPPAALADANNLTYQSGLDKGTKIWIPVDNYNFIRVEGVIKSKPIYYKVSSGDELNDVSKLSHVSQSTIQRWNALSTPDIRYGQILQIGWIAFDATQVPFAKKNEVTTMPVVPSKAVNKINSGLIISKANAIDSAKIKPAADTSKIAAKNAYEDLYNQQVTGQPSNSESGAAVFYPLKMKTPEGVYYAFHNTAAKGTIIKVTNPANGNFIYAKVIGTIPGLPDYNNSIIALSTNAAKGLLAQEKRMFCKIEYR